MAYVIYGKRTLPIAKNGSVFGPDARFAALDGDGNRVSKLTDARVYETKEEAQAILDKVAPRVPDGVVFEIRKC